MSEEAPLLSNSGCFAYCQDLPYSAPQGLYVVDQIVAGLLLTDSDSAIDSSHLPANVGPIQFQYRIPGRFPESTPFRLMVKRHKPNLVPILTKKLEKNTKKIITNFTIKKVDAGKKPCRFSALRPFPLPELTCYTYFAKIPNIGTFQKVR